MEYKDYYKVLGVPKTASAKEIKSAFRGLALQHHPDKNPGDKQSEERFKEINEAYEALGDANKRAKYDQLRASYSQWERSGRPGAGFDFSRWSQPGARPPAGNPSAGNPADLNDLFGQGNFSDFFNSLFGDMGSMASRAGLRVRGQDITQPVAISLEEAFRGTTRALNKGGRRLQVNIPAGARSGLSVRVAGEGGPGQPPGDLFLKVELQPHPVFKVEEFDLHVDVTVDLYTLLLGGQARVPTLNGEVVLTIPPETPVGKTFRLTGRGLPKLRAPGEAGDLYAHIAVQLPGALSEQERALFNQLAALRRRSA